MLDIYAAISNTSVVSVHGTIMQTMKLSLQFTSVFFFHCSMGKLQIFLTNSYLMQPQVVYSVHNIQHNNFITSYSLQLSQCNMFSQYNIMHLFSENGYIKAA